MRLYRTSSVAIKGGFTLMMLIMMPCLPAAAQPPPNPTPPPEERQMPQDFSDGAVVPLPEATQDPLDEGAVEEPPTSFEPMEADENGTAGQEGLDPAPDIREGPSEAVVPEDPGAAVRDMFQGEFADLADTVQVDVAEPGLVELTGTVERLVDKLKLSRALSERVEGTLIVNRIEPVPPKRLDHAIERDIEKLIEEDEFLSDYNLSVGVQNQVVYLAGSLPSYNVIEQAVWVAASVEGVRDVIVRRLEMQLPQ